MSAPKGSFSRYSTVRATSVQQPTIRSGRRPTRSISGAVMKRENNVPRMNALAQNAATLAGAWYTVSA